ncbi:MAG TPA: glycosyltransferase, partial [Candidatus Berkiella sp.]|nr:glycosyltransferase [Candidatus Berkiella sp.]
MCQPSVSIIIAVKNAKAHLAQTLASIRAQCYPLLEVIVIDGASTDGTLDIISENCDLIHYVISEPDKGISDAFNKGLRQATGDYINFQGAGDVFYTPHCLEQLFHSLDESYQL